MALLKCKNSNLTPKECSSKWLIVNKIQIASTWDCFAIPGIQYAIASVAWFKHPKILKIGTKWISRNHVSLHSMDWKRILFDSSASIGDRSPGWSMQKLISNCWCLLWLFACSEVRRMYSVHSMYYIHIIVDDINVAHTLFQFRSPTDWLGLTCRQCSTRSNIV